MKKLSLNPMELDKATIALLDLQQLTDIIGGVSTGMISGASGCCASGTSGANYCQSGSSGGCGSGSSQCITSR